MSVRTPEDAARWIGELECELSFNVQPYAGNDLTQRATVLVRGHDGVQLVDELSACVQTLACVRQRRNRATQRERRRRELLVHD